MLLRDRGRRNSLVVVKVTVSWHGDDVVVLELMWERRVLLHPCGRVGSWLQCSPCRRT